MAKYTFTCADCGSELIIPAATKASAQKQARLTWMQSKGSWYCHLHKPFSATDKAPLFAAAWRLLAPDNAPVLYPRWRLPQTKWEADFCIPGYKLLIEIDGGRWKAGGGRHNSDSDRDKINHAVVAGYSVLRFSTQQVENDPARCVQTVLDALKTRGLELRSAA